MLEDYGFPSWVASEFVEHQIRLKNQEVEQKERKGKVREGSVCVHACV